MSNHEAALVEISFDALADVNGGFGWDSLKSAYNSAVKGVENVYGSAVKSVVSFVVGGPLAKQMYGADVTSEEKHNARVAVRQMLDSQERLPSITHLVSQAFHH